VYTVHTSHQEGNDHDRAVHAADLDRGAGVSAEATVGVLLILLPIAFNGLFFDLARTFEYPDILRLDAGTILTRFHDGGTPLLLRWWAFVLVALAFVPIGAVVPEVLAPGTALTTAVVALGIAAGLVQVIGLIRWPFLVPELARRYVDPAATVERRETIEIVFSSIHRLLGVGIGEHLGYLLTGLWSAGLGLAILATPAGIVPAWLAVPGLIVGLALMVGSLEFVGPNEPRGWSVAEKLVPIAYVGWSAWLVVLGFLAIL
jgi:hypothetical protein